jgi:hypothetical protein
MNSHVFLTLALDGEEWSDSYPGQFNPGEEVPSIHWIEGWVRSIISLNAVEKRRSSFPYQE